MPRVGLVVPDSAFLMLAGGYKRMSSHDSGDKRGQPIPHRQADDRRKLNRLASVSRIAGMIRRAPTSDMRACPVARSVISTIARDAQAMQVSRH